MINFDLIFPEIFLSLTIMLLLMIGVFKKNSERLVYNLSIISSYNIICFSDKFILI